MAKKRVRLDKQVTNQSVPWEERAISILEENRRNILYLVGGIVVFFVLFVGITIYFKNYESDALKMFTKANALYNTETVKEKAQDYEKTLEAFEEIVISYPRSNVAPFASVYLSDIYYSTGDFAKALENYKKLIQGNLDESLTTFVQYGMGKTYESMGEFDDALKHYEVASKRNSSLSSLILMDIGRLMEKLDRAEDAKSKYQSFIDMNPDSPFRTEIIYQMSQL